MSKDPYDPNQKPDFDASDLQPIKPFKEGLAAPQAAPDVSAPEARDNGTPDAGSFDAMQEVLGQLQSLNVKMDSLLDTLRNILNA